jgi:hypothetical protein
VRALEPCRGSSEFVELAGYRRSSFNWNEAGRQCRHGADIGDRHIGQFPERYKYGSLPAVNGARPESPAGDTGHSAGAAARAGETADAACTDPNTAADANASCAPKAASHGAAGAAATGHCPGATDNERAGACDVNTGT